ncbi:membrane traffic protein [Lithospermum erythrorhizon]|uniref:Reticulon-like protein n=1 Tax=Lithospermum erythrorhizon TaxID=34254 RepID=A0AAV3PVI7_LITER
MGVSKMMFNREISLHQVLGGGLVADVILWRQKDLTVAILMVDLAVWVVFEKSRYTFLSFVSSVLLLLFTILFLWAKSAAILNRPAPPLPQLYLSDDMVNEVASTIQNYINMLLSRSLDIALARDSKMFFKAAISLSFISVIGRLAHISTLVYTGVLITLTVPAICERYEDNIEKCILMGQAMLQHLYMKIDAEFKCKAQTWILEKEKLS